jgi:hypothetical protein
MKTKKSSKLKHEDKLYRCQKALIDGKTVNRKTLGRMGIAVRNDSLHSLISTLRNKYYIPIEDNPTSDGTKDYFMTPQEIASYKEPELRKIQKEETENFVTEQRITKRCVGFFKFVNHSKNSPPTSKHRKHLDKYLYEIWEALNAHLKKDV